MQLGACLGQCPVAERTQNAQACVHLGEEAVEFALHAALAKPAQVSHERWRRQLARAREVAGMAWVASQVGKCRAMKMFCQIRQNLLDGIRTCAQHVCLHRGDRPTNLQLSPPVGLSSVDCPRGYLNSYCVQLPAHRRSPSLCNSITPLRQD
jgi:hypothetical protein